MEYVIFISYQLDTCSSHHKRVTASVNIIFLMSTACEGEAVLLTSVDGLQNSITASSADSDDPVEDVLSGLLAWCTVEPFVENSSAPYIQFNFTRTVSLTHMTARGAISGSSYVTEFRLEILDDMGAYEPYGVTDQPTVSVEN